MPTFVSQCTKCGKKSGRVSHSNPNYKPQVSGKCPSTASGQHIIKTEKV